MYEKYTQLRGHICIGQAFVYKGPNPKLEVLREQLDWLSGSLTPLLYDIRNAVETESGIIWVSSELWACWKKLWRCVKGPSLKHVCVPASTRARACKNEYVSVRGRWGNI